MIIFCPEVVVMLIQVWLLDKKYLYFQNIDGAFIKVFFHSDLL